MTPTRCISKASDNPSDGDLLELLAHCHPNSSGRRITGVATAR